MRILSLILIFASQNSFGSDRMTQCLSYLDPDFGQVQSAKVIQVGHSLREKFKRIGIKNAILLANVQTPTGFVVVLRPFNKKSLLGNETLRIDAQNFVMLELTAKEHEDFEIDSREIGLVYLTFHKVEKANVSRGSDIFGIGSVIQIDGRYFVAFNRTAGSFSEHGSRSQATEIFHLAAFGQKPLATRDSEAAIHKLELGGFYGRELDGKAVGPIKNIGTAVLDVRYRIGSAANNFSSTVVDFSETPPSPKDFEVFAEARNYQMSIGLFPRLIEARPDFATRFETDADFRHRLGGH